MAGSSLEESGHQERLSRRDDHLRIHAYQVNRIGRIIPSQKSSLNHKRAWHARGNCKCFHLTGAQKVTWRGEMNRKEEREHQMMMLRKMVAQNHGRIYMHASNY